MATDAQRGARPTRRADTSLRPRTLLELWRSHIERHPDRPALVDGAGASAPLRWGPLGERTAAAAAALVAAGARPGGRVLWRARPGVDAALWIVGALRLGAVVVPVDPSLTPSEVAYVIDDVRPDVAVVDGVLEHAGLRTLGLADVGPGPADADLPSLDGAAPGDDALVVYTSGTTGTPKGAVHTHASLLAGVTSLGQAWGWGPEDRLILSLPLFHVHGLCAGLFGTLASGASAMVFERFDASEVARAATQPETTMFFGVPTMYHRLTEAGAVRSLSSLRLCVSGSAPLPAALWHRLARAGGVSVLERYGMSETLLTLSNPLQGERRPGSVGVPLPGVEARIEDPDAGGVGQLLVRGPMLCRGYWERPQASAAAWHNGWFATGDLASVDGDGYYSIRGRLTELIITGGHNVYPAEVEVVVAAHPSVLEVAVVGEPSEEWGETVVAYVVGAPGGADVEGIRQLAHTALASYKRPRDIRVVRALPRNAMGKVVRSQLG